VLKGVSFEAGAGHHDRARRVERLGQEHADRPGDGVQPARPGAHPDRRPGFSPIFVSGTIASSSRSVLQESFLFDGTIAENVGYARPGASREEIIEACRVAHCDEFVSQFPAGLRHHRG
jgi:hypothetical protein